MTEHKEEKDHRHFFDVENFAKIHSQTQTQRGRLGRVQNRISWTLSSSVGIFTGIVLPVMLILGPLVGILMILYYGGGLAFYAAVATFFVLLGFFGEKKFGAHMQFKEYHFWRRLGAQLLAYSMITGILLLMILVWSGKLTL